MDVTLIVIDSDAELARARALVHRLWDSEDPADIARLQAQARLIAAYEESKWPRRPPSTAELIRHLMDQYGLTRADMIPLLGMPSRVSEVLRGKKELSMAMVQRLRTRFRVPAAFSFRRPKMRGAGRSGLQPDRVAVLAARGRAKAVYRRPGQPIIARRRTSSAHLHRPWRAIVRFCTKLCDFAANGPANTTKSFPYHECKAKPSIGEFGLPVPGRIPAVPD
jgi:HTH-type transcriptional regulator / antitoxin HigA